MKTIYWSKYNVHGEKTNNLLMDISIKNLYSYIKNNYPRSGSTSTDWIKCPAVGNILSKTHYVGHPIDISIEIKNNKIVKYKNPEISTLLNFRTFDNQYSIMDYLLSIHLFCEDQINANIMTPYLDGNKNFFLVPGSYDISSWFRPINPSFLIKNENYDIDFIKGRPMMYISFSTQEKINFKEFYFTDTLKDISFEMVNFKKFNKRNKINNLYKLFNNKKVNKVVLKEIRKSII